MSEKRFTVNELVKFNYSEIGEYVDENHTDRPLRNDEVVDLLNEQQSTITELKSIINFASNEGDLIVLLMKEIIKLRQQLQEKQEDEKLYANEILELNKTKKEMLNFKQLGGDY